MSHIVKSCPLTKLNGGISRLHSVDEDAVSWLTSYGSWHAYENKKTDYVGKYFLTVSYMTTRFLGNAQWTQDSCPLLSHLHMHVSISKISIILIFTSPKAMYICFTVSVPLCVLIALYLWLQLTITGIMTLQHLNKVDQKQIFWRGGLVVGRRTCERGFEARPRPAAQQP